MRPRAVFIGIPQDSETRLSESDGVFEHLSVSAVREQLHASSPDDCDCCGRGCRCGRAVTTSLSLLNHGGHLASMHY